MPKLDDQTTPTTLTQTDEESSSHPTGTESPADLLGKILETSQPRPSWPIGEPFVAECTDAQHPTLQGRVKIHWDGIGHKPVDLWVPTLHGQAIRQGDRLLVQMPHGGSEPIVLGVIDGFLPRPEPARTAGGRIELKQDETLQVCSQEGQPLVEIVQDQMGPVVRLMQADTKLDLKGKLSITAEELELKASKGQVRIEATDDINLVGEVIHLN
jgi:hypothetical protein